MSVVLICHLQRIEPLCPAPTGPGTLDWYFSLNLAASLETAPPDTKGLPYLTPWYWVNLFQPPPAPGLPIKMSIELFDPVAGVTPLTVAPLDGAIVAVPAPDLPHGNVAFAKLIDILTNQVLGAPFGPGDRDPVWKPSDPEPTNVKLWAHLQGRLGSLAYPLSQWLNLSLCFKFTLPAPIVAQLQGLAANQRMLFFAAPTIQIPFPHLSGTPTETWTPDSGGPTIQSGYRPEDSTTWKMNGDSTAGPPTVDPIMTAYLQAVAVANPASAPASTPVRLRPLASQWANGNGNGWSGARWQSTLIQTLTSTFDLASRLTDAARKDAAKIPHDFQPSDTHDLTVAALALLRDLADAGLRPLGNGKALIDDEIARVTVKDLPKLDPAVTDADKEAYLRGLKRSFRAAVQWSDRLTTLELPESRADIQAGTDVFNWYWQLVNAAPRAKDPIDTLLALPPNTSVSAPPSLDIVAAAVLLDRLQAIFGSDSVVATLLTNAWGNAVPPNPSPIVLPMNAAVSFVPLTTDTDPLPPAPPHASGFTLNGNELTAVPGVGYVTAAYHFTPTQQLPQIRYTLSVRLRYAKAASPFEIVTAFRLGNFPATDFHAHREEWTILSRLTDASAEPVNTSLRFDLDPALLIPGDTPQITVVAYYQPAAAGAIMAVWEAIQILPVLDFFTIYDRGLEETGSLSLTDGTLWGFTVPQLDQSALVAGKSAVYRLALPTDQPGGSPLFTVEVTAQQGADFLFAWLAGGQRTPIPVQAGAIPWATYGNDLSLRIQLVPTASGWNAVLGYLDRTNGWTDLDPLHPFPVAPIAGAQARLRIIGCVTADQIPRLNFQVPSALDFDGQPDLALVNLWFPRTFDNKPLLFWQSAQRMANGLEGRLPRSRLAESLVSFALPSLLSAMNDPNPSTQVVQLKDALSNSLAAYCDTRFGQTSTPWGRFYPPAPIGSLAANSDALYKLIKQAIDDYAREFVKTKIADPYVTVSVDNDGLADTELTPRPHPLVIDFDLPGHQDALDDEPDLLNQLAGVALFLTATRTGKFHSASMARIELNDSSGQSVGVVVDNALIPFRPSYINQQRIVTLSYDNVPLPLNARDHLLHQPQASGPSQNGPPQFQLVYKPASGGLAKPPLLRFGDLYNAAVALITPGAALPKELQYPTASTNDFHPARLGNLTGPDPTPVGARRLVRYLRHVGISHPRCFKVGAPPSFPVPTIPQSAKPLAREMRRECYSGEFGTTPLWFDFVTASGSPVVWSNPPDPHWTLDLTDISLAAPGDRTTYPKVGLYATTDPTHFDKANPVTYLFGLEIVPHFDPDNVQTKLDVRDTISGAAATVDLHQSALFDLHFDFSTPGQVKLWIRESAFDSYRAILTLSLTPGGPATFHLCFGIQLDPVAPGANLGSLACTAPVLLTDQNKQGFSGKRHLPTLDNAPPPLANPIEDSLPLVLLTPGTSGSGTSETDWNGTNKVPLSFGKPSAEFEVWWRSYRAPTEAADRITVLAEVSDRRNRLAQGDKKNADDWVDDPAVDDTLVFEAIPLRLATLNTKDYLDEATVTPTDGIPDPLAVARKGTVQFEITQESSDPENPSTARSVLQVTPPSNVSMTVRAGEVWEVRVYSRIPQAKFDDANAKSLAKALKLGARSYTGKDGNPYWLVSPHCFLVEAAADVSTAHVLLLTSGTFDFSSYQEWLEDLSFSVHTIDLSNATAPYLTQFDLIVVLPATPPSPAWLTALTTLVKPLAVPVIVLGAKEAEALGLGTAQPVAPRQGVILIDTTTSQSLEKAHLGGDFLNANLPKLNWTAPSLTTVPAASLLIAVDSASPTSTFVVATDRLQQLAVNDLAAERRVAWFLTADNAPGADPDAIALVSERFFKGAVRWAARWPLAERLWEATSAGWNADADRIEVSLDRRGTPKFDLFSTFEGRHQAWRWQGTPVTRFPFELNTPDQIDFLSDDARRNPEIAASPLLWDAEGFGRRPDSDVTSISPIFPLRPLDSRLVDSRRLATDLRAAYFRYTIVATSRYAGFAPVATVTAAHFADPDEIMPGQTDSWRRAIAPCRIDVPPPPPKPVLKLVLPLTHASTSPNARSKCPGLLGIFNDTWFQTAGLAETLRAEIELRHYKGPLPTWDFAEYGPDPMESGATVSSGTPTSAYTPALVTSGPSGTTFDAEATEALYTNSWFIIEALPLPDPTKQSNHFAWNFAKLRFRRGLLVESLPQMPAPIPDFRKTTAFDVRSSFDRGTQSNLASTLTLTRASGDAKILTIALSYDPNETSSVTASITTPSNPTMTATLICYEKLSIKVEFRSFGTATTQQTASSWLVQPYLRGERTHWHALDPFVWSDPFPANVLSPILTVVSQQGSPTTPVCSLVPVPESDATDSVWVQILPDSNWTNIQPADGTDNTQPIAIDQLRIRRCQLLDAAEDDPLLGLKVLRIDDPTAHIALGRDKPPTGGYRFFVRVIALTALIKDFRGRTTERFIGIYAGNYGDESSGEVLQFVPIEKNYRNPPSLGAGTPPSSQRLSVTGGPSEVPPPNTLQARVVTLQWRAGDSDGVSADVGDLWGRILMSPKDFPNGQDEPGRIISVSPPFGELIS